MRLFNLFSRKEQNKSDIINNMISFSTQALQSSSSGIEDHGTFLPFGAELTKDKTLQLVVYHDPEKQSIDPREHATIIQKVIAKKYEDANCEFCHMAFDGISHLKTCDIDSISVRVRHNPTNTHKLISFTYKVTNSKIEILSVKNANSQRYIMYGSKLYHNTNISIIT